MSHPWGEPLGTDALQQRGSWFFIEILSHQLAFESALQDGLQRVSRHQDTDRETNLKSLLIYPYLLRGEPCDP